MTDYQSLLPVFRRDGRSLMYALRIRIDGRELADYGVDPTDGVVRVGAAEPRTTIVTVPGRAGALDLTLTDDTGRAYEAQRTLEFDVVTVGDGLEAIEAKQALAGLNGRIVTLEWENLPGFWRGRCAVGAWTDTWLVRRFAKAVATVTVTADPWLWGDVEAWDIGVTPKQLWAHGDRPSPPVISVTPPAATKRIYITINDRQLVYNLTDADGAKSIVADCDMKTSTWDGRPIFPSVDSDYPTLLPGFNTASVTAGTARITHQQRLMI